MVYSVALIPNDSAATKLSSFLGSYTICLSSLSDIVINGVHGIIVDVDLDLQPELIIWLREGNLKTFALDWYVDDGSAIKEKINLRDSISALKYCIIREEFHKASEKYAGSPPQNDVVVVIGGGDLRGYLPLILKYFTEEDFFLNKKIVIVLGPMVNDSELSLSKEQNNISFLKNPGNIAEIMASTHIGISNGGTSLMEFTMLGVPTIIFPQSEREETFISPFLERRCGILGSIERHEFIKQFNQLWEDITLRKSMSETGRKLIDGLGAIRIAEAIESFSRRIMNNESFGY